jgi:hypothetical protein
MRFANTCVVRIPLQNVQKLCDAQKVGAVRHNTDITGVFNANGALLGKTGLEIDYYIDATV